VVLSYPRDVVGRHAAAGGATQRSGYLLALALGDLRVPVGIYPDRLALLPPP
jgi:hypothetical protein